MAEDWYRGRVARNTGHPTREVRLTLSVKDWATFDAIARSREWGRSKTASYMIEQYALLVRSDVVPRKSTSEAQALFDEGLREMGR